MFKKVHLKSLTERYLNGSRQTYEVNKLDKKYSILSLNQKSTND